MSPLLCKALMLHPLVGPPSSYAEYLSARPIDHAWGLLGGFIWAVGTVSNLISGDSLGFALSYAIGQAAPMVATLWGLLYYKEFAGAGTRTLLLVLAMFTLYTGAILMVALSKK